MFLFFPAISGNQTNAQDTINAVNKRKKVLADIYQANECVTDIPVYSIEQIKRKIDNNQALRVAAIDYYFGGSSPNIYLGPGPYLLA